MPNYIISSLIASPCILSTALLKFFQFFPHGMTLLAFRFQNIPLLEDIYVHTLCQEHFLLLPAFHLAHFYLTFRNPFIFFPSEAAPSPLNWVKLGNHCNLYMRDNDSPLIV